MQIAKSEKIRALLLLLASQTMLFLPAYCETSRYGLRTADHLDWLHFNPYKFEPKHKLVPSPTLTPAKANVFSRTPLFPSDPTKANLVFGRGSKSLPTVIYSKAFDILQIGNKYYQAPAAGESKILNVNGQTVTIYGCTVYSPLPDNRMVANPARVAPFDPSRIFYRENETWPSIIYAEPGQKISIANQTVTVPPAGQTLELTVTAEGQIKLSQKGKDDSGKAMGHEPNTSADKNDLSRTSSNASISKPAIASAGGKISEAGSSATNTNENKAAAMKASTEKAAADKTPAEKAPAEKAAADKAPAEKAAADKISAYTSQNMASGTTAGVKQTTTTTSRLTAQKGNSPATSTSLGSSSSAGGELSSSAGSSSKSGAGFSGSTSSVGGASFSGSTSSVGGASFPGSSSSKASFSGGGSSTSGSQSGATSANGAHTGGGGTVGSGSTGGNTTETSAYETLKGGVDTTTISDAAIKQGNIDETNKILTGSNITWGGQSQNFSGSTCLWSVPARQRVGSVTINFGFRGSPVPQDLNESPEEPTSDQGGNLLSNIYGKWHASAPQATGRVPGEVTQNLTFHVTRCNKNRWIGAGPGRNEAAPGPYTWVVPNTGESIVPMDHPLICLVGAPRYSPPSSPGTGRASEGY